MKFFGRVTELKNICVILSLVGISLTLTGYCNAGLTYIGDYVEPYQVDGNIITFTCTNATVKIEFCTEDILRIRMSPSGNFRGNEPWVVIRYDWTPVSFTTTDKETYIKIKTNRLIVWCCGTEVWHFMDRQKGSGR